MLSLAAILGTLLMLSALLWIADFAESRLGQHPAAAAALATESVTRSRATPDRPVATQLAAAASATPPVAAPVAAPVAGPVAVRATQAA